MVYGLAEAWCPPHCGNVIHTHRPVRAGLSTRVMVRAQHAAVVRIKELYRGLWLNQVVQLSAGPIALLTILYSLTDGVQPFHSGLEAVLIQRLVVKLFQRTQGLPATATTLMRLAVASDPGADGTTAGR